MHNVLNSITLQAIDAIRQHWQVYGMIDTYQNLFNPIAEHNNHKPRSTQCYKCGSQWRSRLHFATSWTGYFYRWQSCMMYTRYYVAQTRFYMHSCVGRTCQLQIFLESRSVCIIHFNTLLCAFISFWLPFLAFNYLFKHGSSWLTGWWLQSGLASDWLTAIWLG